MSATYSQMAEQEKSKRVEGEQEGERVHTEKWPMLPTKKSKCKYVVVTTIFFTSLHTCSICTLKMFLR